MAAQSFKVRVTAEVAILLFKGRGDLTITFVNNVFEARINELSINFFNIIEVNVDGYFRSNGEFQVRGSVDFTIPLGPFELFGGVAVDFSHRGFAGEIYGGVRFSIDLGLFSISFNFASLKAALAITMTNAEGSLEISAGPLTLGGSVAYSWGPPSSAIWVTARTFSISTKASQPMPK